MLSSEQTLALPPVSSIINTHAQSKLVERAEADTITLALKQDFLHVIVPRGQEVLPGRNHASHRSQPPVDRTQYGATASGTSRIHAAIQHDESGWWLKDLGSSNGTWLNGERIAPLVPHRLGAVNHVWRAKLARRIIVPGIELAP